MNRKEAKALLPVIQAFAEGKDIQYRSEDFEGWRTFCIDSAGFENEGFEWRVKPEKQERWINIYDFGRFDPPYKTKKEADTRSDRIACIRIEYEEGEGL